MLQITSGERRKKISCDSDHKDSTNHQNINQKDEKEALEKEKNLQKATLKIKQKYGKNAILKGMNLEEGATTRERNEIIGGHKA